MICIYLGLLREQTDRVHSLLTCNACPVEQMLACRALQLICSWVFSKIDVMLQHAPHGQNVANAGVSAAPNLEDFAGDRKVPLSPLYCTAACSSEALVITVLVRRRLSAINSRGSHRDLCSSSMFNICAWTGSFRFARMLLSCLSDNLRDGHVGLECVQQPDFKGADSRQQGRGYSHLPHTGMVQHSIHPMPTRITSPAAA